MPNKTPVAPLTVDPSKPQEVARVLRQAIFAQDYGSESLYRRKPSTASESAAIADALQYDMAQYLNEHLLREVFEPSGHRVARVILRDAE